MASDSLKQIGNYIKDTKKDTDFGLKRYHANIPRVERTRDVFDSDVPFQFTFKTEHPKDRITLNLIFNKPPPLSQCNNGCVTAQCQTFNVTPGDHLLTVDNPYNAGSVTVFVDYVQALASGFEETNPEAGTVFVQGSETTSTITICYTFGDCASDFNPCPPLLDATPKAFVGLTPIFMDRFDRTGPEDVPAGGCGYWDTSGSQFVSLGNGTASIQATAVFEPFNILIDNPQTGNSQISSDNIEVLMWVNINSLPSTILSISLDGYEYGSSFILANQGGNFQIRLTMPVLYTNPNVDPADSPDSIEYASAFRDTVFRTAETGTYFIRVAQISGSGLKAKLWKEEEAEPSSWIASVNASDISTPNDYSNPIPWLPTVRNVGVSASAVKAITVWGEAGRGAWDSATASDPIGTTWSWSHCYPNPDGLTRFLHCSPEVTDKNRGTTNGLVRDHHPGMGVGLSWPHFIADTTGLGRLRAVSNRVYSFPNSGNAQEVIISGEITASNIYNQDFGVTFYTHSYGLGEPGIVDDVFVGTAVGFVTAPGNDLGPGVAVWAPFEFSFPVNGDYFQWSCAFTGGAHEVEDILGAYAHYPQFLAVNNYGVGITIKNLKVTAVGALWCSTHPFCPDSIDDYEARCGNLLNFSGSSFPAFCGTGNPFEVQSDFYTPVNGPPIEWHRGQGVSLTQSAGVAEIGFTAFGVTTDGSDGKCIKKFITLNSPPPFTNSLSESTGELIFSGPFDCTDLGGQLYYEFRVPNINLGSWESTAGTKFPELDISTEDNNGFASQIFIGDSGFSDYLSITGTQNGPYDLPNPVTNTGWYAVRFQAFKSEGNTDQTVRIKYWSLDDVEPDWLIEDQASSPISRIEVLAEYSEYIDNNTVVQIRNVEIIGASF